MGAGTPKFARARGDSRYDAAVSLPRCFGVLGDPVAHSRTPVMHAAAFASLGLPHRYLAFYVRPERLAARLRSFRWEFWRRAEYPVGYGPRMWAEW